MDATSNVAGAKFSTGFKAQPGTQASHVDKQGFGKTLL